METQPYWRLGRGLNPLAIARFTDNQTQRPVEKRVPMGIEPTSPGLNPGVLSQLNYGVIRWASGVIERRHSMPGIEPGPLNFRRGGTPSFGLVEDNRSTSAHLE